MNNRVRYTKDELQRNTFYQMPKFLFENEFKQLSNDARILYCLLKDRHELSLINNWINEDGEVYLVYTRENMQEILNLSENTVTKAMKNLKKFDLIHEERQGQGKPNKIYLLAITLENNKNLKFCGSRNVNSTNLEPQNLRPINTNINNTKNNNTESSHSQSHETPKNKMTITNDNDLINKFNEKKESHQNASDQTKQVEKLSQIYNNNPYYTTYEKIIKENIDYNYLKSNKKINIDLVDEIILCILDVLCTESLTVKIGGENKNRELVKNTYLKLNHMDIEHVVTQYKNQYHKITHKPKYIKTMLYNVKMELSAHYSNLVNQDMLKKYN